MTISIEIPEGIANQFIAPGQDPSRTVLEAVALEGYRSDQLSESHIRELLGFETLLEVHRFLKEHDVFLHYTADDLDHDLGMANTITQRARIGRQDDPELRAG